MSNSNKKDTNYQVYFFAETAIDVFVTDISGKLVYKIGLDNLNNLQTIDLSNVQNGIYFVQLINKQSKLLWTDKVVISK